MDFAYILTSARGRIPRGHWWAGIVPLVAINTAAYLLFFNVLGILFTEAGRIAILIVQLVLAYPYFAVSAKRFQDRGKPAWLALVVPGLMVLSALLAELGVTGQPFERTILDMVLGVLTLIGTIWYIVELGLLRGSVGANAYGEDPLADRAERRATG